MVYRVYVEKKAELANEARALQHDLRAFLGIRSLTGLRLYNRYDLEGISRELFDYTVKTVLSEPQLDLVTDQVPQGDAVFAVEYLPGQFDQRADSAAQCIQILSQGERPAVRTARVYALEGVLTPQELEAVKQYVINPVESREASLDLPETLRMEYTVPTSVRTITGFTAMDAAGLPLLGVVPEDSDVPYALNRGIPLRDINYYAARAYENIARRITGHQVPLMRI